MPRKKRRRPIWQERSGKTRTWRVDIDAKGSPADPVLSLLHPGTGEIFKLDDYRFEDQPKRWISIGCDEGRDIVVVDEVKDTVSSLHCYIVRDRKTKRVYVEDAESYNGTKIMEVRITEGIAEIRSGMPLRLGRIRLLACGKAGVKQPPYVMGQDLDECMHDAQPFYGSKRKTAEGLAMSKSTFNRWRDNQKLSRKKKKSPDDSDDD